MKTLELATGVCKEFFYNLGLVDFKIQIVENHSLHGRNQFTLALDMDIPMTRDGGSVEVKNFISKLSEDVLQSKYISQLKEVHERELNSERDITEALRNEILSIKNKALEQALGGDWGKK